MLLLKYAMQALTNPVPKSVIFSLKKDKFERDIKASRDVRRKKHSKSRNSKKSVAMNSDETSVHKRIDVTSADTEPEGDFKEKTCQEHLMATIQPRTIPFSHQNSGEKTSIVEVERSSSNGLNLQNDITMPKSDVHVSISIEPECEQIEPIHVVPSRTMPGCRSPLKTVGKANVWYDKAFHFDKRGVSPTRSSIPAMSKKHLTPPRNNLRRRIASTSACGSQYDKENSLGRCDLKADDSALITHDDAVHLPTPRRLRLEDPTSGKAVTELRKLFERKSS